MRELSRVTPVDEKLQAANNWWENNLFFLRDEPAGCLPNTKWAGLVTLNRLTRLGFFVFICLYVYLKTMVKEEEAMNLGGVRWERRGKWCNYILTK